MVKKNYIWIASSILLVIIILTISLKINSSSSLHTLRFGIFESGRMTQYILDGDVYINGLYMGKTNNGLLDIRDCVPGNVEFVPGIQIKLLENDKPKFEMSCNDFVHDFSLLEQSKLISELSVASDFIPYMAYEDTLIRKNAVEITRDCPVNNKACMSNEIFNSITSQIKYVEDARDIERVQSVAKTLTIKAGDCEDQTIILSSYLESVGIKTMMLLTNSHIYMLACGLNFDDVKSIIPNGKPFFWYDIKGEKCFVADPTLPNSYLGYSANVLGEKIAVDPLTKEYFILDKESS